MVKKISKRKSKVIAARFGNNLRKFSVEHDFTQLDIASRVGVTVNTVKNWERGDNIPNTIQWEDLAEMFGCEPEEFVMPSNEGATKKHDSSRGLNDPSKRATKVLSEQYPHLSKKDLKALIHLKEVVRGFGDYGSEVTFKAVVTFIKNLGASLRGYTPPGSSKPKKKK